MCAKKIRADLLGKRFGRLVVIAYSHTNIHGQAMWLCKCDCGKESIANGSHLMNGHTSSCGCLKAELTGNRRRSHGKRKTRLYRIWLNMKNRCSNEKSPGFQCYGGRGITVCEEWANSFEAFYEWSMANGYSDNLSIDRIDNDGNYCPENCRWVDYKTQSNNKRTSAYIEAFGQKHTVKEWSEITGINYGTLYSRYKANKTIEEIFAGAKAVSA